MKLDFAAINAAALSSLESLVTEWLPAGRREGHEWKVGSLSGEPGRSLSINLSSGVWKDFSTDAGGGDPVSLLAAIRSCGMKDAAVELVAIGIGHEVGDYYRRAVAIGSTDDLGPAMIGELGGLFENSREPGRAQVRT
jgi:hypothetical protein